MIKSIINRLIEGTYKLSQALNHVKALLAEKNLAVSWIDKEVSGYEILDKELPAYRKIYSPVQITVSNDYDSKTIAVKVDENAQHEQKEFYTFHYVFEPISVVEEHIKAIKKLKGYCPVNSFVRKKIEEAYKDELIKQGLYIQECFREIPKVKLINIIEQTKIRLIDYLHELGRVYPELIEKETMKDNSQDNKNVNISNIFGGAGTMNIASGVNVTQNVSNNLTTEDITKLLSFGVTSGELEDLKLMIQSKENDKPNFASKVGKWIANTTASIVSKGVAENIPQILEIVNRHMS
jgi:hypothetical protein